MLKTLQPINLTTQTRKMYPNIQQLVCKKENSCFLLDLQQVEAFIRTTLNSSFITEVFVWLEFSKPVPHQ
jgi:hypothetical protein